jgi:hypothetical protein
MNHPVILDGRTSYQLNRDDWQVCRICGRLVNYFCRSCLLEEELYQASLEERCLGIDEEEWHE